MFETQPTSTPQKIGIILYGLVAGASTVVVTAATSGLLVGLVSRVLCNIGLLHLGDEMSFWLPIIAVYFGFYLGIVVGAIVCWKVCQSRLRRVPSE